MSRSDDPAHWNDGQSPHDQGARQQAHPNSPSNASPNVAPNVPPNAPPNAPQGQEGHAQHAPQTYDPNFQPAAPAVNPDPYAPVAQAPAQAPTHVQPQAPQSQYVDAGQQIPPSQIVDPVNYQQPVPAHPPATQYPPQGQVPVEQAYTQNQPAMQQPQAMDPYQQAAPQTPYPPQLDELATQVQAASHLSTGEFMTTPQPAPEPYNEAPVPSADLRHEHSIPSPGYPGEQSQYAAPHQPAHEDPLTQTGQQTHSPVNAAQQTADELQTYLNQQAAEPAQDPIVGGFAQDQSHYQTTQPGLADAGYQAPQAPQAHQAQLAPQAPHQASDYDLGELMAAEPATQTYSQSSDHFSVTADLPPQSQHVDFGQAPLAAAGAAHAAHGEIPRDVSHVADHFTQGGQANHAAPPSLEPPLQNDADFYAEEYVDEEYEDYEETGSRMGGVVKILATLSLAIITGAGLAYGYKFFASTDGAKKYPAIIRADSKPAKIRPSNPGGKKFAHSKKSIYSRVGAPGAARVSSAAANSGSDSMPSMPGISLSGGPAISSSNSASTAPNGGAKRVRTVSVRPDGTYAPTKPLRPARPANLDKIMGQTPGVSIPGITVGGSSPSAAKARVASTKKSVTDELVRQIAKRATTANKPVVRLARATPKAAAPIIGTSPNGYVSQISARKSRIDALSAFADLQQRYGSVLSNSQPDIQEANLGAKGVWYRLRIGPPGSKQAATDICSKLKSAGHKGCFVRAY